MTTCVIISFCASQPNCGWCLTSKLILLVLGYLPSKPSVLWGPLLGVRKTRHKLLLRKPKQGRHSLSFTTWGQYVTYIWQYPCPAPGFPALKGIRLSYRLVGLSTKQHAGFAVPLSWLLPIWELSFLTFLPVYSVCYQISNPFTFCLSYADQISIVCNQKLHPGRAFSKYPLSNGRVGVLSV